MHTTSRTFPVIKHALSKRYLQLALSSRSLSVSGPYIIEPSINEVLSFTCSRTPRFNTVGKENVHANKFLKGQKINNYITLYYKISQVSISYFVFVVFEMSANLIKLKYENYIRNV